MTERPSPVDGTVRETAPAKINLCLHVTGQRADGYHLLDSIVTFAALGDQLTFSPAKTDSFHLEGRFGPLLSAEPEAQNLVLKARDLLREALVASGHPAPPVAITLEKNLPVAAGIGGGSADAAAAIRGLLQLWQAEIEGDVLSALAVRLGADVPMCMTSRPLRVSGIGDVLQPLSHMPAFAVVLGNPLKGVSTPAIFQQLTTKTNPPAGASPQNASTGDWIAWLADLRNDLEPPARALLADISALSERMADSGAELVRMSGSGASCFGIYSDFVAAQAAADSLSRRRPDWYFAATTTMAGDAA